MKDHDKTRNQLIAELQELRQEVAALNGKLAELQQTQFILQEQARCEDLISNLSTEFVNLPADAVDRKIQYALKRLVECLGHDRTSVRLCAQTKSQLRVTHWWAVEGTRLPPDTLPGDAMPYVIRRLLNGKPFVFSRLDELPVEAQLDRQWFATLGQKSALAIPLQVGGSVIGGLTFASFGAENDWQHPVIQRLGIFAKIVANTLDRKRTGEELQRAHAEVRALRGRTEPKQIHVRHDVPPRYQDRIVGQSRAIKEVMRLAQQVAETDSTVLLVGETGTGKDLLAYAIHQMSPRRNRPMVTVNCSALPPTLIESELFGRERGAFTGACSKEIGRFELAHGSTLFLDEIGELTLEVQARLLRALELGRFERLGSPKTVQVDTRIIVATNKDLPKAVEDGTLRRDLYYRLNVFPIVLPPLRCRREDIPDLVWSFVCEYQEKLSKRVDKIPRKTMANLENYSWPGNIRELKNTIERAMIMSSGPVLNVEVPRNPNTVECSGLSLEDMERNHILNALKISGGRVKGSSGAAEILQINPSTLFSRMRKLGIRRLQ